MWSCPFNSFPGMIISLRFEFESPKILRGLRIWNYNGKNEDSCIGARHIDIFVEQKKAVSSHGSASSSLGTPSQSTVQVTSRLILRKAPGEDDLEYAQFIHLNGIQELSSTLLTPSQRNHRSQGQTSEIFNLQDTADFSSTFANIPITVTEDDCSSPSLVPTSPDSPLQSDTGTCLVAQQYETPVSIPNS